MQPETRPTAITGAEQLPMPPVATGEQLMGLPPLETGIERGAERVEQVAEASAVAADAAGPAMPMATVQLITDDATAGAAVATPVTAADDEVIEKEWVDKAKAVVQATRDDPYARTSQVGQLQRDYLKKRFGREIGAA